MLLGIRYLRRLLCWIWMLTRIGSWGRHLLLSRVCRGGRCLLPRVSIAVDTGGVLALGLRRHVGLPSHPGVMCLLHTSLWVLSQPWHQTEPQCILDTSLVCT